jgi:hypothetical protein
MDDDEPKLPELLKGRTLAEFLTEGTPTPFVRAEDLLPLLGEGIWHTTSPTRYRGILKSGAILPEPQIPDSERWKTTDGPKHYPFVRSIGGVSLFDFKGFEPESYTSNYRMSSWETFVPYCRSWGAAIWLEIDRAAVSASLIDPKALVEKWNRENAHAHTLMPMIEAAHIGQIPLARIRRAVVVADKKWRIKELPFRH